MGNPGGLVARCSEAAAASERGTTALMGKMLLSVRAHKAVLGLL